MQIISAHAPRRTESGGIDLKVTFAGVGEVPFHATSDDCEAHGRALYTRAMLGEFGDVAPYAEPTPSLEELTINKLNEINDAKNVKLSSGFYYDGILFDSDEKARLAYLELTTKFQTNPEYTTQWKASRTEMFSTWVNMNKTMYDALTIAYEQHIQECFQWQGIKEQEVAASHASEDAAAIKAISTIME